MKGRFFTYLGVFGACFGLTMVSLKLLHPAYKESTWTQLLKVAPKRMTREEIAAWLGGNIERQEYPDEVLYETEKGQRTALVEYGIDTDLQAKMDRLIQSYKPDFCAFVAMDATTGQILAISSYTRRPSDLGHLALRARFPTASVFKVVTATAALELDKLEPDTVIPFNGRSTTLYRKNVEGFKANKWSRYLSLRQAFAQSVNPIFAKIGLFYLKPEDLISYAGRFGFNRDIPTDMPIQRGIATITPDDRWSIAESASGFTRQSRMSPVQGALMAAAAANDGVVMEPYIITQAADAETLDLLYEAKPTPFVTSMSPGTAEKMRDLMQATVDRGTSRKSFRKVFGRTRIPDDVELGGKTGSLDGDDPKGRTDWFVGYGRSKDRRIAVAAVTVNEKYWTVKSAYLAGRFLEDAFDIKPTPRAKRVRTRVAKTKTGKNR